MKALCWVTVMILLISSPLAGETDEFPCEAPGMIQKEIDAIQSHSSKFELRVTKWRELMKRFPNDLFLHKEYQMEYFWRDPIQLEQEYKVLFEKNSRDAKYHYLYGRALDAVGRDQESLDLYQKALELAPDFPQLHLELASYYYQEGSANQEKLKHHSKEAIRLCPANPDSYDYLTEIHDLDFVGQIASKLREFLAKEPTQKVLALYPELWVIEFRVTPVRDHDKLRKTIAKDLDRLKSNEIADIQWWLTLKDGYNYLEDYKQVDKIVDEITTRFPEKAAPIVRDHWFANHPRPLNEEETKKYYQDFLSATETWIKKRPQSFRVWADRLDAVNMSGIPTDQVEEAVEAILKLIEKGETEREYTCYQYLAIAETYLLHNMHYEQIPGLLKKAIEAFEFENGWMSKSDEAWKEFLKANRKNVQSANLSVLAQLHLKKKEFDKVESVLREMDSLLKEEEKAKYWEIKGQLAEANNQINEAKKYMSWLRRNKKLLPKRSMNHYLILL